ncbi:hypothetical protein [Martelella soudanensis]|uniref:hypothetical protein n=1 Tax=unclassified Martelella TaxID=2629616 RepID=UPI0015DE51FE|nr:MULTISPECIES: hypothetical protein [unclassified Martelella]
MTTPSADGKRALAAAKSIFDGRVPPREMGAIMVTLEHAVATVLLAVMDGDAGKAAAMLNEGLAPGIEQRLAHHASRKGGAT